jgi:cytochrome P450
MVALADDLLSAIEDDGRADLVQQFFLPLVHRTISLLVGVADSDAADLLQWTRAIHQNEQPSAQVDEEGIAAGRAAYQALTSYFTRLVAARRHQPADDLVSAMIAECDSGRITKHEMITNTWALYLGGFDTTANASAMSLGALQEQPDQRKILLSGPSIGGPGLEELLRVTLIAVGSVRFLGESLQVRDVTIPAGSLVYLSWSTYNSDPSRWSDPFRLDVTRDAGPHMTFSQGPHTCLGQWLARAAVSVALEAVYRHFPDIDVGPLEWAPNPSARLVRSLPARWSALAV